MKDLDKRLVEVEYILKKLDKSFLDKIPLEIWEYLRQNKNINYTFNYDENKRLDEQDLNIDTIAILTYINIEYLLGEEQKREMIDLLKKDEFYDEVEKMRNYNVNDIFNKKKKSNSNVETEATNMIQYKENKLKNVWSKILKYFRIIK